MTQTRSTCSWSSLWSCQDCPQKTSLTEIGPTNVSVAPLVTVDPVHFIIGKPSNGKALLAVVGQHSALRVRQDRVRHIVSGLYNVLREL